MSGHSKWANIKHRKGAQDAKRAKVFSRISKMIIVAAQQGGGDPDMNGTLKVALTEARAANMPKDNIERAIKRGTGESGESLRMEDVIYEAISPEGVAMIIVCTTDNTNRALTEVKTALKKNNAKFVPSGSVSFQFDHVGQILIDATNIDSDALELIAIDAGAKDIESEESDILITTAVSDFSVVQNAVTDDYSIASASLVYVPQQTLSLDETQQESYEKLYNILDDLDDVQDIYDNRA